ncbi:MAG: hypothetical protein HXY30_01930 [Pseudorhodoplanes sp.]|nr:hypothetical protein [Pseudorhodoplanes sp.]
MIAAIFAFVLPSAVTRDKWSENAAQAAPRFEDIPGPIRTRFPFDHGLGGGVHLWASREAAEDCHAGPWRESVARVAESDPRIEYFDAPAVVDNARGGIVAEAA